MHQKPRNSYAAIGSDAPNYAGSVPIRNLLAGGREAMYESTEYIGSVSVPTGSSDGNILFSSPLNPLLLPGTRLFAEASTWERWKIVHCYYTFRTMQNQTVTGQLLSFVDPDPDDTWTNNPQNLSRAAAQMGAQGLAVYKDYEVHYPRVNKFSETVFYTNPTQTSDSRFSTAGYLKVINAGGFNFSSTTKVYQIYMHCKIHFFQPELTLTSLTPVTEIKNELVSDITKLFLGATAKSGIPVQIGADGSIDIDTSNISGSNILVEGSAEFTNLLTASTTGRLDIGTGTGPGVLDWGYDPTYFPGAQLGGSLTEIATFGQALLDGTYSWAILPAVISTIGGAMTGLYTARQAGLNLSLVPSTMRTLGDVYESYESVRRMGVTKIPRTVRRSAGGVRMLKSLPSNELATFGSTASWQMYTRGTLAAGNYNIFGGLNSIPGTTTDIRESGLNVGFTSNGTTTAISFTASTSSIVQLELSGYFAVPWSNAGWTNTQPTVVNLSSSNLIPPIATVITGGTTQYTWTWQGTVTSAGSNCTVNLPNFVCNTSTSTNTLRLFFSAIVIEPKITSTPNFVPAIQLAELSSRCPLDAENEEDTTDEESEEESQVSPKVKSRKAKNNSFSSGDDMSTEGFVSVVCDKKIRSVKKV